MNQSDRQGVERLSDADRKALPDSDDVPESAKADAKTRVRNKGKKADDVGRALRSVYDNTLGEDIPDDFLDLLGKLD
jgi:hypothetical protein